MNAIVFLIKMLVECKYCLFNLIVEAIAFMASNAMIRLIIHYLKVNAPCMIVPISSRQNLSSIKFTVYTVSSLSHSI